jgi:hypothetical protein
MMVKKDKKITSPEGEFSFRPKIGGTLQGSMPIRIGPRFEIGAVNHSLLDRGEIEVLKWFQILDDMKGFQGCLSMWLNALFLLTKCP